MKNKTYNNEKLVRGAIRARRSIKKRSNEQDKPQKRNGWLTRFFALVGCLLLVSALAVPCFADYNNGSFDPVVSTIPAENLYLNYPDTFIDLSGWYCLEFSNYIIPADQVTSLGITDGDPLTTLFADDTAYLGYYANNGVIEGWEINQLVLGVSSNGTAYIKGLRPTGNPMSFEGYIWLKDYPLNNVYNSNIARSAWSLFSFETVRYAGGSDVPIAPSWVTPTQKSVENADFDLYYTDTHERISTSLYGFYEISFTSLDYSHSANLNTMLIDGTEATVYFAFIDGTDDGIIYEVASVSYDGGSYADGMLILKTYGDAQHNRIFDAAFDISRVALYVSTYPGDAYNEEAFIASGTTHTVSKLVQPFSPDKATTIWSQVMAWITNAFASIQSIFYVNGSLTFLGTLAIIGVSIAIGWLIIGVFTRFFQLWG